MKRIICGVEYDTEKSTVVKKYTEYFWGDPRGFEETLYVTEGGKYFLYTNGGSESKYKCEKIVRMGKERAKLFIESR